MNNSNFEVSIKKLENIVSKLENSELSLDEMINLYEEGIALSTECNKALDNAEFKITEISNKGKEND